MVPELTIGLDLAQAFDSTGLVALQHHAVGVGAGHSLRYDAVMIERWHLDAPARRASLRDWWPRNRSRRTDGHARFGRQHHDPFLAFLAFLAWCRGFAWPKSPTYLANLAAFRDGAAVVTYLDIALAALSDCEKSERSEKSPVLSGEEAERLKAEIVAGATVDPAEFDREAYDALWARWNAHEADGGPP